MKYKDDWIKVKPDKTGSQKPKKRIPLQHRLWAIGVSARSLVEDAGFRSGKRKIDVQLRPRPEECLGRVG